MGRKSEGTFARLFFGSILKSVLCHSRGTSPLVIKSWKLSTNFAIKKSGAYFSNSATSPRSSADFCSFIRFIALYTSLFSQAVSVNWGGCNSPPGSPANSCSNMSANSFASGCPATLWWVAFCMWGSNFQELFRDNTSLIFDVFQVCNSCLCLVWIMNVNRFLSSTLCAIRRSERSDCRIDFLKFLLLFHTCTPHPACCQQNVLQIIETRQRPGRHSCWDCMLEIRRASLIIHSGFPIFHPISFHSFVRCRTLFEWHYAMNTSVIKANGYHKIIPNWFHKNPGIWKYEINLNEIAVTRTFASPAVCKVNVFLSAGDAQPIWKYPLHKPCAPFISATKV